MKNLEVRSFDTLSLGTFARHEQKCFLGGGPSVPYAFKSNELEGLRLPGPTLGVEDV